MWIKEPGEINERLLFLGTRKNCLYLVKGDRYMLIGGGGQWVVPELEKQIHDYGIDMDRVQYLLIGHTHYDHCGAVPYLQKRYPHMEILASRGAVKLFSMEKAVNNMRRFSRQVMEDLGRSMVYEGISLEFDGVKVSRGLKEGDRIQLDDTLFFTVYETPGHSRCAMSAYAPNLKWLFPSDSLCIPIDDAERFASTASESYTTYLESLKKLQALEVRLCAWEHHGVMTEADAHDIVKRGIVYTLEAKRKILSLLEETKDPEFVAHWATKDWLDRTGFEFLPYDVMLHISRFMIKNAVEEQVDESAYL
jgi:2-aminobenzoylacetyl-CoA thioesterase